MTGGAGKKWLASPAPAGRFPLGINGTSGG